MRSIKWLAMIAMTMPALAVAQVGPNPAAEGGSLDPTVGPTRDPATAPQDAAVGTGPTVTVPENDNGSTAYDPGREPTVSRRTTAPTSETSRKKPR